ncbi:MAG: alpha/beta fold hydrolase [Bacilli bacterium]
MQYKYDNIKINYEDIGSGEDVIVLLHGWGQNIEVMKPIGKEFENNFRVIYIDFPGFGASDEPNDGWCVDDYAKMLKVFLDDISVKNPILIGHSFGCRVSICFNLISDVKKMVFTGAAGIRPKRGINYYVKVYTYKAFKFIKKLPIVKRFKFADNAGSEDYRNASDVMRKTLVKVVNEDLRHHLSKIKCPVLMIWGKNDEATPISDGRIMESLIEDSALIEIEGTHYAYLENINYFNVVVKEFLK